MNGLQQTYNQGSLSSRADFNKDEFDTVIQQKGRRVILEQALQCPCKSVSTNQQSNCKNCGGSGWVFVNATETRMILQAMDIATKYRGWSEEMTGTVKISCRDIDHLTFMDRITVLDGEGVHNEVLHMKKATDGTVFAYSTYMMKRPIYVGRFENVNTKFTRLIFGQDYIWEENVLKILNPPSVLSDMSLTVRYIHAPAFYVLEMSRETMQSFEATVQGNEKLLNLPLSGLARRAQYIPDAENLNKTRILDNDYPVSNCLPVNTCGIIT